MTFPSVSFKGFAVKSMFTDIPSCRSFDAQLIACGFNSSFTYSIDIESSNWNRRNALIIKT